MNAERQIIGSLILDSSRIDEMHLINSEMFQDSILGDIFSLYEHSEGKEINQIAIVDRIKSDFMTEQRAIELIGQLVSEHDAGISDKFCIDKIFDSYRAKKVNEFLDRLQVNPQNVDSSLDELRDNLDGLRKSDEAKAMTLSDLTQYSEDYFKERKNKKVFNLGFEKIDKAISGLDDGDMIIIAARPAVGKSAFSLQIIRKFGRDGYKVGYFNLEMAERQIYERSIAAASGIDMNRIRLATTFLNDEKQQFDKGNEILQKENNVMTFSGSQSVNSIRAIQKQYGFDIIVIDYLQLIQSTVKRNNRAAEVGDISRGIKKIAMDFNIPVIALSQLNRASEMNKDKEPTMSELRESGDIEQDASVILMLWNPNPEDMTEKKIKVEKSRNGFTERETLYFDGKHMTFSTINTGFQQANDDLQWS